MRLLTLFIVSYNIVISLKILLLNFQNPDTNTQNIPSFSLKLCLFCTVNPKMGEIGKGVHFLVEKCY